MSRAAEANDRAAMWIIALEDGPLDDADQRAFDAWLAESDHNKAAYWRLKHSWREADRIGALGGDAVEPQEPLALLPPAPPRTRRWWLPAAVAASIALLVAAGILLVRPGPQPGPAVAATYATPIGGRRLVRLSDGSRIELNTASSLRTAMSESSREVWLDRGEAYFEVRHAEGRPFVVHAGNRQVTVLGTRFSVRRDGDRVTVSVVEGRVRVDEVEGPSAVRASIITGGDIAVAQGPGTLVTGRSEERVESALAWREGRLSFDQTRLADIAAEFNRYNRRPLVVTGSEAANLRLGGIFPASDPDAFARLLRDAYGLRVEESPDSIRISS